MVDTNADPDGVDYLLPGNDDALRSIRLFVSRVADAVSEGVALRSDGKAEAAAAGDIIAQEILAAAKAEEKDSADESKPAERKPVEGQAPVADRKPDEGK
jgi:small subunit ribosomal protein S2